MPPLVFVVDADRQTPLLIKGTEPLTGSKFDVRAASDGVKALRWLEQNKPDLIVLSTDLPDALSWQEVVRGIRKLKVAAPVILLTRDKSVGMDEAFSLGIRDVLRRPVTAPVLRESLTSALADLRYQQAAPPAPSAPAVSAGVSEVDVLYALGKSITSLTDLEEILHRVVEAGVFLSRAEQGFLMLLDEDSDELVVRAAKNLADHLARTLRLRTGDSLAGQVVKTGRPLLIGGDQQTKVKTAFLVRSALYVPLKVGSRVIGVLAVDNQTSRRAFSQRDQRFLSAVADYAAIALENSRLHRALHDRTAALEIAYRDLQQADEIKTQMIQNLSHELRTPLVFVKGYIDLLTDGGLMPLPAEVKDGLQTVQRRINDLVRIVENTLALSQPREHTVRPSKVEVSSLIQPVVDRYVEAAKRGNLIIVTDLPPQPLHVMADQRQMSLVLGNLLDNAIKFSPHGGLITVGARALDGDWVEVIVSDSGLGIPADKLNKIFERFYQVDGSTTRRYGGTGLGLAAAREIVQAHGGELTVTSKPGQGSVFRFTLPKAVLPSATSGPKSG